MALTVEEVNEMQDEMNKLDDNGTDGVADAAAEAAKLAEAKVAEDADKVKADEDAATKAKEADAGKKADDGKAKGDDEEVDVIRELKEQVRASNEALKKAVSDYQKLHGIMVDKGLITDEDVAKSQEEEASIKAAFDERQNKLTEMVTIMELNPNYADVRKVCAQGNFDDVIDAFARFYVKENGGSLQETATKMEMEIWSEPNPYKKIYELVKKYHPKYAKADEGNEQKKSEEAMKKVAAEADKVKKKEPIDAQVSAANFGAGGSGAGSSGWTAAKIDNLPEEELSKVPRDIYEKYLIGTLT